MLFQVLFQSDVTLVRQDPKETGLTEETYMQSETRGAQCSSHSRQIETGKTPRLRTIFTPGCAGFPGISDSNRNINSFHLPHSVTHSRR